MTHTENENNCSHDYLATLDNLQKLEKEDECMLVGAKEIESLQSHLPSSDSGEGDKKSVEFDLWETLAYDLALNNVSREVIVSSYEITLSQLEDLEKNRFFKQLLKAKKEEVSSLGADAAFKVKMRMLANKATPMLLSRLLNQNTSNKDFHTLYRTVVELAEFIPEKNNAISSQVVGTTVTFNIQGVPGLEHLSSTRKETEVIDGDFTDIPSNYGLATEELMEL